MEGLRVRDVMTPDVTTLKRNDKLTLADDIKRRHALEQLTIYPSHGAVSIAYSCWYPPVQ